MATRVRVDLCCRVEPPHIAGTPLPSDAISCLYPVERLHLSRPMRESVPCAIVSGMSHVHSMGLVWPNNTAEYSLRL
jgi:hypothetical protein